MRVAVLFDVDGTLVDHVTAARTAVIRWTRTLAGGCELDDAALCEEWLRLEEEHFARYLAGEVTFEEQRHSRVAAYLSFLGRTAPPPDSHARFEDYLRHYERAWTAYPDARPSLDRLIAAGVLTGVLTNGQQAQQQAKLQAVGLARCFTHVVASSTLPKPKPAAQAFTAACQRLGCEPNAVVYVGDDLEVDAVAARAAGLTGVWLDRAGDGFPPPSVPRVVDLHELAELVLGLPA